MKSLFLGIIFAATLILMTGKQISAQIVGGGTTTPTTSSQQAKFIGFFIKFGAAIPISEFKIVPDLGSIVPAEWSDMPGSDGRIGAKTGFYVETGIGLDLFKSENEERLFGFYYYPVIGAYWQTSLDWSEKGDFFDDKAIYTKSFRVIDIGQRYGLKINPFKNFSIGLYYRPGLIIPLDFEIASGEDFLYTGKLASENAPTFMMSHAGGLAVRYSLAVLSVEYYYTRPTMDVTYSYPGNGITSTTLTGKIPVSLLNISLAVSL